MIDLEWVSSCLKASSSPTNLPSQHMSTHDILHKQPLQKSPTKHTPAYTHSGNSKTGFCVENLTDLTR